MAHLLIVDPDGVASVEHRGCRGCTIEDREIPMQPPGRYWLRPIDHQTHWCDEYGPDQFDAACEVTRV